MPVLEVEVPDRLSDQEEAALKQAVRALAKSDLLGAALPAPEASPEKGALVRALSGGREYLQEERLALHLEVLRRSFARRRQLLAGALSAPEVARLLGTSRQTPHDRAKAGSLLAVPERGALRFPLWQFDPEGPDGVVEGLPEVLRALDVSPLAKVSWMTRPSPRLEGRTPLEALRAGEAARVADAARGVGDD